MKIADAITAVKNALWSAKESDSRFDREELALDLEALQEALQKMQDSGLELPE